MDLNFTDKIDLSKVNEHYMQGVLLYESAIFYGFDNNLNYNKKNLYKMGLAFAFYSQAVSTSHNAMMIRGWNEAAQYYNIS